MSNIQDTLWELFKKTGKIDYYNLFNAVKDEKNRQNHKSLDD